MLFDKVRRKRIALALSGLLALGLAVNTVSVQLESEPARADVGRVLRLPGPDLQIREDGRAGDPPLVLLHCFTCSIEWWDRLTPALAEWHRVIRLDLIGHGGSEKPSSGYSMDAQARQVALALHRLDVRDAVVVGQSMGVSVAAALIEHERELVDRLVVIDEAPGDDWEKPIGFTAKLGFVPVTGELIYRVVPESMVRDGLEIAFADGFEVPDFAVDSFRDLTYNAYRDSGLESDDYKDEQPIHERLTAIGLPVLAIFGMDDEIADARKSLAAYREIPGARTATIPGAGHSPNVERPRVTARRILEFGRSAESRR
jgi:pimeloyl-ACP methyl ester carboxylesterase